jgi:hypothetical protein
MKGKPVAANRDLKHCPACQQVLSLSDFWSNKAQPDGKQIYCKECDYKQNRARRVKYHYTPAAGRECALCSTYKDASNFYVNPKVRSGLASYCHDCARAYRQQRTSLARREAA